MGLTVLGWPTEEVIYVTTQKISVNENLLEHIRKGDSFRNNVIMYVPNLLKLEIYGQ